MYETLGPARLAEVIRGLALHGFDGSEMDAAEVIRSRPGSYLPRWIDAGRLASTPPEVVVVFAGHAPASGADLAHPTVARAVRRVIEGNMSATGGELGDGSAVTVPHAGLFGADPATYAPVDGAKVRGSGSVVGRVLDMLGEAKKKKKKMGDSARGGARTGRHFVSSACRDVDVAGDVVGLEEGDEFGHFMRARGDASADTSDVVVICATPSAEADDTARVASLGAELGAFGAFVEALRARGVRHAAVFTAGASAAGPEATNASCEKAKAEEAEKRRSLLFSWKKKEEDPPIGQAAGYVCDDLCKLQTNIVTGLIFFWTVLLCILFGYALMHNLDTPHRFERSKEETDGR